MTDIKINLRKSIEENAGMYFEKAKKLKKKILGAKETVEKVAIQVEGLERRQQEKRVDTERVQRKKSWYEKFRWFISSEGFLVVGGRDATTNEIIIKKQTAPEDMVFHTDMAGSPFFVVKTEGKQPGLETIKEVADATFSFSRAGKSSVTTSTVFYVKPDQVSKAAQSGEFLPKGAFMVRGKVNYVENKFNVAVGLYQQAIMAGPVEAVRAHCEKYVVIIPGDKKPSDVAKMIRKLIGGDLDEIIRALPSGNCDIKR